MAQDERRTLTGEYEYEVIALVRSSGKASRQGWSPLMT